MGHERKFLNLVRAQLNLSDFRYRFEDTVDAHLNVGNRFFSRHTFGCAHVAILDRRPGGGRGMGTSALSPELAIQNSAVFIHVRLIAYKLGLEVESRFSEERGRTGTMRISHALRAGKSHGKER